MLSLLEPLLDSWDRNNTILINLLCLVPVESFDLKATEYGSSIHELFILIYYVRLVFVEEDAPEFAQDLSDKSWLQERKPERLIEMLKDSAKAVRDAVANKIDSGSAMKLHYDHPILMLQHMIWHEGYHHGQIKLILKLHGQALDDDEAGQVPWDIWMDKSEHKGFIKAKDATFNE